ncbi:MAG: hypothetical protein LBL84_03075 [Candidatus Nomurabacteria bacterium]|jgi:tRNA G10  N-methylase Trm11|nr:hypothetical protein [Candidatus Nomurabacteria bacterium]
MFIAILGRQPALGTAEIESVYGSDSVSALADDILQVKTDFFDIARLGGTKKAGVVFATTDKDQDQIYRQIAKYISNSNIPGKVTLGLSAYHLPFTAQNLQKIGLRLKNDLKKQGKSLRLVPNDGPELSTATSHHNKLGLSANKIEILLIGHGRKVILAAGTGAQNITAYAARDQKRPKRDAFVGMLPPKLAQIIVNLAAPANQSISSQISKNGKSFSDESRTDGHEERRRDGADGRSPTILDPFCGTGVILQEALLMGHRVYGTDFSEKMIDYSRENLSWLKRQRHWSLDSTQSRRVLASSPVTTGATQRYPKANDDAFRLELGDATKHKWHQPINAVASEVYLGQPFSAPPSPAKLAEVRRLCRAITTEFLTNLAPQIKSGTALCLAVPAWRLKNGQFERLDILDIIEKLGYNIQKFKHVKSQDLLYYREDQVVGRELLVLKRS